MALCSNVDRCLKTEKISLFREDCLNGMEKIGKEEVSVVVTSPPYNIGVKYNSYNDKISRGTYLDWIERWAEGVVRVLDSRGSLFLNMGSKPSDPWVPTEVALRIKKYLCLQNTIHWIKSIVIEKNAAGDNHNLTEDINVGHIKPINSRRYLSDAHEYIFHFTKQGDVELDRLAIGTPYKDKSNKARWKSNTTGLRCRGNTWFIPYKTIVSREKERPHPASFPAELAEMCIKLHGTTKTTMVLDPFMGIGNTALACINLNRAFIGFEIDQQYFDICCKQIQTALEKYK